ncbi:MAG: pantetheine-phosphate adenylyltransferase [Clostridiales bacterium]|jgi:pantetheine-phosphate adenylyltransferase|nr:pantetheine-phosphate adenylyltransferase [Clostridiales bacterium]
MKKTAVFAGTFDPFTIGHHDIVARASRFFDELYIGVAVGAGGGKSSRRSADERVEIARLSVADVANARVTAFESFLVDFAKRVGASAIVRGLRNFKDLEYERALTEVYRSQNPDLEILYLISSHNYAHVSSTIVRELALLGGKLDGYVCGAASGLIKELYSKRGI